MVTRCHYKLTGVRDAGQLTYSLTRTSKIAAPQLTNMQSLPQFDNKIIIHKLAGATTLKN